MSLRLKFDALSTSTDMFSVGAFADSAFEYMLKQWLLSSRVESKALNLCTLFVSVRISLYTYESF